MKAGFEDVGTKVEICWVMVHKYSNNSVWALGKRAGWFYMWLTEPKYK